MVVADVLESCFKQLDGFFECPGNFYCVVLFAEVYELRVAHCVFDVFVAEEAHDVEYVFYFVVLYCGLLAARHILKSMGLNNYSIYRQS